MKSINNIDGATMHTAQNGNISIKVDVRNKVSIYLNGKENLETLIATLTALTDCKEYKAMRDKAVASKEAKELERKQAKIKKLQEEIAKLQ